MSILRITGGNPLSGDIKVHGAKNSVLPIMAASLISAGETVIHNCPALTDVTAAMNILRHLGCKAELIGNTAYIDTRNMSRWDIPASLMHEMRSSSIFLGAILARTGMAELAMPGGCELGPRPIDLHLDAMRNLGAIIDEKSAGIVCCAPNLKGGRIALKFPSVGATENSMIAACACDGVTVIENAAREPEIRDLGGFLNAIGAEVSGAGTSVITVGGKKKLKEYAEYRVIPDRIVATTYLAALASSGGMIRLNDVLPEDLKSVTDVLAEMGVRLNIGDDWISASSDGNLNAPRPVTTSPYPGFPTDAQPPIMAASLLAGGTTVFVETIFENRYRHVSELLKMGADIKTDGRVAMISGVKSLHGAQVEAADLRAGASLVVAALAAQGTTLISGVKHIERGYESLSEALKSLGASAEMIY